MHERNSLKLPWPPVQLSLTGPPPEWSPHIGEGLTSIQIGGPDRVRYRIHFAALPLSRMREQFPFQHQQDGRSELSGLRIGKRFPQAAAGHWLICRWLPQISHRSSRIIGASAHSEQLPDSDDLPQ